MPRDLKAAATIDGAGFWTQFRAVYLPFLVGPLTVALVLRTIEAFKVFDIIWVMTRGGPANSTKYASRSSSTRRRSPSSAPAAAPRSR